MRICKKCGEAKELLEFSTSGKYKGLPQFRGDCKKCNASAAKKKRENPEIRERQARAAREWKHRNPENARAAQRKSSYGITDEQFRALLLGQNNKCLICGFVFENTGKQTTSPHVDHCHATRKVRGLLCWSCNIALGYLKDNLVLVMRAAEYLQKFS